MTELYCPLTGQTFPPTTTRFRSAAGAPLAIRHRTPAVTSVLFDDRCDRSPFPFDSGVWRFRELIHPDLPEDHIVSRPEGNTPLFRAPAVQRWSGVQWLRLKHEGMNPTGSFKDRGMTVAVSQAVANGARAVVCASTGNTSASMASYAALAGLPAIVLVPEGKVASGKLVQALAYGARTLLVRGDFDAAMGLVQHAAEDLGLYLVNSLNPFRLEGQKTIIFELLQQLRWDPPDWVALPAGNLGNTSAFGAAIRVAVEQGLIARAPRLLSVQAEGASPFAAAFARDFDKLTPVPAKTIATAIQIGDPVSYARAVESLRFTDGHAVAVTDAEILEAKAEVDAAGVGAEPASCASVAGVRKMVREGVIQPNDRVVCILTGHLLKDPDTTLAWHEGQFGDHPRINRPQTIDPTIEALAAIVRGQSA